jgi:hypothetical protein
VHLIDAAALSPPASHLASGGRADAFPATASVLPAIPTSAYPYAAISCSAQKAPRGAESAVNAGEIRVDFSARPRPGTQNPCKTALAEHSGND